MIKKTLKYIVLIVMGGLFSCTPSSIGIDEYAAWVENPEHELHQQTEIQEVLYDVQYKPYDYILNQEGIKFQDREEHVTSLEGMHYFNLVLKPADPGNGDLLRSRSGSLQEYQRAIYYMSYLFREDLKLLSGNDTIPCALFHFVRDHGLSPGLRFAIGFEKKAPADDLTLIIRDEIFRNGRIQFHFDKKTLQNIPSIKHNLSQL